MSKWNEVGHFLKEQKGPMLAVLGSVLTGNVPGAIALGAKVVASALNTDSPSKALGMLKNNDETLANHALTELSQKASYDYRGELLDAYEKVTLAVIEDEQVRHSETQETVRAGDKLTGNLKWVRPSYGYIALIAAVAYILIATLNKMTVDLSIVLALLGIPGAYMGLRTYDNRNIIMNLPSQLMGKAFK